MNIKLIGGSPLERTRIITDYLHDIKKYPVLTKEEENELIKQIREGNEEARTKLINCNLKFVFAIAKCYTTDDKLLDLVNEGNFGLMLAIKEYDINKPNRFLSYAVWYIRRSINYYLINDNMLVKRTNGARINTKLANINSKYYNENGRLPSESEIIDILEKQYNVKIQYEKDLYDIKTQSIYETLDDSNNNNNTVENSKDFVSKTASYNDYENTVDAEYNEYLVHTFLSTLNEKDMTIMKMYFGVEEYKEIGPQTFYDIALNVNMSSERIRQIVKKTIQKLKQSACYMMKK